MIAKLNDYVLGPDTTATWSLTNGGAPYIMQGEVETKSANAMVAKSLPGAATFTVSDKDSTFKATGLTILGAAPTSSPYMEQGPELHLPASNIIAASIKPTSCLRTPHAPLF